MHLGRPRLQFSNGPVSTDKHIYIYIRTWWELKEPQTSLSTTSSFYRLENGVLETLGRTIVKLELELRFSVLCPPTTSQTFRAHTSALCTHTHTHTRQYIGVMCAHLCTHLVQQHLMGGVRDAGLESQFCSETALWTWATVTADFSFVIYRQLPPAPSYMSSKFFKALAISHTIFSLHHPRRAAITTRNLPRGAWGSATRSNLPKFA